MFRNTQGLVIPNGEVTKITSGAVVLWEKIEESGGRIPVEYREVEYITADETIGCHDYLDLGFAFDTKARIEMTQYIDTSSSAYTFGAAENSGKLRCMVTSPNSSTGTSLFYGSTGSAYISVNPTIQQNAWNEFEIILESGNLTVYNKTTGDTKTKDTQGSYTMTNNLYLFAQNYNGTGRYSSRTTISAFKYYDKNDALICDLVPCYRKSDGVIGMYDIVRNIFLSNANASSEKGFAKGADVVYS